MPGKNKLGSWNIGPALVDWISDNLPEGKTILELGSGVGSEVLAERWNVYSVEHDKQWIGKYQTNYIYAPISNGWYDLDALPDYDLLIVDGPPGTIGREGILSHLHLFDLSKPMIIDDMHRTPEKKIAEELSKLTGRPMRLFNDHHNKQFAVL